MSGTPKSQRQPPQRRFENYVLTRNVSTNAGLSRVSYAKFKPCSPALAGEGDPGGSQVRAGISVPLPIGFNFSFDGITYTQFVAMGNGHLVLCDPTVTFATSQVYNLSHSPAKNTDITISANHVLLAPWFDNMSNGSKDTAGIQYLGSPIVDGIATRIIEGFQPPFQVVNQTRFGVRYYSGVHPTRGRHLIVRWYVVGLNNNSQRKFEVVIYENGAIEFRYSPRAIGDTDFFEHAAIGIFMRGSTRFRDLSWGLGYRDGERQQYKYGGLIYNSTYSDQGVSWSTLLQGPSQWPGGASSGAIYTFSPPVNRRKILPRAEVTRLASLDSRSSTSQFNVVSEFDDRRSLTFTSGTSVLVNYPTTIQRLFGDTSPGIIQRQDLFAGDFEFTASVVRSAIDQFIINDDVNESANPFVENGLYTNDPVTLTDNYFTNTTSSGSFGDSLQQSLRSKTAIKLSFTVDNTIKLSTASCNIYYLNQTSNIWNVPLNASYTATNFEPPTNTLNGDQVPAHSNPDSGNQRIIEDIRGFGPIGNAVSSGSHDVTGSGDQTNSSIGASYSTDNVNIALGKRYSKSVRTNPSYNPIQDETFNLPIDRPFLIEKAVIEIPMTAGPGWFNDRTTSFQPLETVTGSFDFAGPAMTVALFNRIGGNQVASASRMDLILTGTITHAYDTGNDIIFSNFPSIDSTYQLRPQGFAAFKALPSAVVSPKSSTNLTFTGSVIVKCEAQASNGVIARLTRVMKSTDANLNRSGVLDLFNAQKITLGDYDTANFVQRTKIAYINNYGRAATGFAMSGRSIFGKEITAPAVVQGGAVDNPYYMSGGNGALNFSNLRPVLSGMGHTQFVGAITGGTDFAAHAAIPIQGFSPSPYLVYPNDTLVLAVSKTRPFKYGNLGGYPYTSGGLVHDLQLITGSVILTLYGSYIRGNAEFHEVPNQTFDSNAIHDVAVGAEPILDQFMVEHRDEYVNGYLDDYVTGSLVTRSSINGVSTLVTASRGRAFSKYLARSIDTPSTASNQENITNPSLAYRSQPNWERANGPRATKSFDVAERFFDSMMPTLNDCFTANGAAVCKVDPRLSQFASFVGNLAFIRFDSAVPTDLGAFAVPIGTDSDATLVLMNEINDRNWTKSFPFEPRYSAAARQLRFKKKFTAAAIFSSSLFLYSLSDRPELDNLIIGAGGQLAPGSPLNSTAITLDVNLAGTGSNGKFVSGSMSDDDQLRYLFGFGDSNTCQLITDRGVSAPPGTLIRAGTNHDASFRRSYLEGSNNYAYSPLIRGWKYGAISGLPAYNSAYFRTDHYGQFRDMLEQRPYTKFQLTDTNRQNLTPAAVTVRFLDVNGRLTDPANTWSQNLSLEATSSLPYFDEVARNRPDINTNALNASIITFKPTQFGQITL